MFACHAAAAVEAFGKDLAAGRQHALDLIGVPFVKQQNWMQVAVARMEHVDNSNVVFRAYRADALQNVWQLGSRYDTILRAVARAQSADRAERLLAGLPQLQTFFGVDR